jgi:hypothetical protein
MEAKTPHRNGAVTAKRAKRSVAAAKRLNGDGPMWPPATEWDVRSVGTSPALTSRQFPALALRGFPLMGTQPSGAINTGRFLDRNIMILKKRKLC